VDSLTGRAQLSRTDAGVGLVSVLVAIVLIAIGIVALSSSSAFMASLQTDASERSTAAAIAIAHMETAKMRKAAELVSEDPVTVNEAGVADASGAFTRSLTVEPEATVAGAVRVTVEVDYPAGLGRTRTVRLVTIIYQGGL